MNYNVISVMILIGVLGYVAISYERNNMSIKEISLISTMAGLAGVSRVPFVAIPNVQPTTFLVIISGYVFGPGFGFMVGAVSTLVSNSFLGHGPWTPWQMAAWGLAGCSGGILKKTMSQPSRLGIALFCFMWGFLFDYIMNLWHWLFFVYPLSIKSFIAVYLSSFYFDLMHAMGNFSMAYLLGLDFINVLFRFKERIVYSGILIEKNDT